MEKNRKGLCIGSMIIGIISILMFVIQPIILIVSIVGIIIGIIGLKTTDGKNMAVVGIVLSSIGAAAGVLILTLAIGTFAFIEKIDEKDNGGHHYIFEQDDGDFGQKFEFYFNDGSDEIVLERPDNDDNLL